MAKIAFLGLGMMGGRMAARLLEAGHSVITLTNSFRRENPFNGKVQAFPFHFDQPARLRESLHGMDVLINTYWVRFDHRHFNHGEAVTNTKILFQAAKSHTHPMVVPGVHRVFVQRERRAQIAQDAQIIEWMHIAGDRESHRAHAGPIRRRAW